MKKKVCEMQMRGLSAVRNESRKKGGGGIEAENGRDSTRGSRRDYRRIIDDNFVLKNSVGKRFQYCNDRRGCEVF